MKRTIIALVLAAPIAACAQGYHQAQAGYAVTQAQSEVYRANSNLQLAQVGGPSLQTNTPQIYMATIAQVNPIVQPTVVSTACPQGYVVQPNARTPGFQDRLGRNIGAITGIVAGSQIGGGSGRIIASGVGGVVGGEVGEAIQHGGGNQPQAQVIQGGPCQNVVENRVIAYGYVAVLRYLGQDYAIAGQTNRPLAIGQQIRVQVTLNIVPLD